MSDEEKKKELTLGERVFNWAKALGIILPLVGAGTVSVLGWFKSDDAQGDVTSLVTQLNDRVGKQEKIINSQSEKLEKMYRRIIFFQSHQAGFNSGKIFSKLEATEQRLDRCVSRRTKIKKDELMELLGQARVSQKQPSPKVVAGSKVQQIPRLYPKPFKKEAK